MLSWLLLAAALVVLPVALRMLAEDDTGEPDSERTEMRAG
jgi:hypothetical protein